MYRNRKKPVSFTKTHTQKNKYEDLSDSELNTKTREFENTNVYYLSIDKIYKAFLEDFEKNNNSFIEAQLDLEKFYKQNLLRDAHEGKALFFIKYPIHDVYFATKIKEANDPDLYEKNLEYYQNRLKNDLLYISIKPTKKLLSGEVKIKPLLLKIALYRDDTVLINRLDDMCKKIRHYKKLVLMKNKR